MDSAAFACEACCVVTDHLPSRWQGVYLRDKDRAPTLVAALHAEGELEAFESDRACKDRRRGNEPCYGCA